MSSTEKMKVNVCVVGDSAVGKTSLIRRFVHDDFNDHYISTLGAKVTKKQIVVRVEDGNRLVVDVTSWDIMGEDSFRDLRRRYTSTGSRAS